ncbi:MAG TPA: 4-(cytidine 5'-diphospho)-2-C-methyl-D-erythritol kinase [Acidobacteriaceae bacterium]
MRVRSFSKINLGLAIGPVRPDGFHALATSYQTLAAHDFVTVEARPASSNATTLTSTDERVPTDARNTAWKMVERALAAIGRTAAVTIHIEKRLPVQGGLGAGSANAVAALIGLEQELARHGIPALPAADRLRIAAEVGSDVPLFLIGGAVLGTGRGEIVSPLGDLPLTECVLALPDVGVSTPQAFRDWDEKQRSASSDQRARESATSPGQEELFGQTSRIPALTAPQPSDRLEALSRALSAGLAPEACTHSSGVTASRGDLAETVHPLLALVRTGIENDFEEVVFRQHPLLGEIKRVLAGSGSPDGALCAALSGSGSALFGLYGSAAAATAAEERLSAAGVRSLRTQTLPRQEYWDSMMER